LLGLLAYFELFLLSCWFGTWVLLVRVFRTWQITTAEEFNNGAQEYKDGAVHQQETNKKNLGIRTGRDMKAHLGREDRRQQESEVEIVAVEDEPRRVTVEEEPRHLTVETEPNRAVVEADSRRPQPPPLSPWTAR
jgi:hypothetical protein